MAIWVKTWGDIINASEARLKFFQERLNYRPSQEQGLVSLQGYYDKYLPAAAKHRSQAHPHEENGSETGRTGA